MPNPASIVPTDVFLSFNKKHYPLVVLLVDDQAFISQTIIGQLASEKDLTVHSCANGEEALAKAIALQPTVILQDLMLPDLDGMALIRCYREHPLTQAIPVIVLSSQDSPEIKTQAFAEGANDYLVKLPDRAELIARIRYHSKAYIHQLQRDDAYQTLYDNQQCLTRTNIELEQKNQALANFAHMVAHDLKNPLVPIKGYAELLLEECVVDDHQQYLKHIINNTKLMVQIINGLLAYSKSGHQAVNFVACNLQTVLSESLTQLHWQLMDRQAKVESALNALWVMGCRELLIQMLVNLISNAIKYCPPERTPAIQIATRSLAPHWVEITVADNGCGINPRDYETIFNEFTRLEASLPLASGSGIGLATVKKIIYAHSGSIRVESVLDQGSTFILMLKASLELDSLRYAAI